jgi:hypothetical protein
VTGFLLAFGVATVMSAAASPHPPDAPQNPPAAGAINVNWLYGAYVPKEVPLEPLTLTQRRQLFIRQTFLTYGTYIKTGIFAVSDSIQDDPAEWAGGFKGFTQRYASRYGQFSVQNALSATGNALLGYEPRYERCRCSGGWPRVGHALARNFVTYNRTERERRPQIAMYAAALGAGLITSTWRPGSSAWSQGWHSVLTQVAFGSAANVTGEFWPEVLKFLKGRK